MTAVVSDDVAPVNKGSLSVMRTSLEVVELSSCALASIGPWLSVAEEVVALESDSPTVAVGKSSFDELLSEVIIVD